jgi:hypothetical protein
MKQDLHFEQTNIRHQDTKFSHLRATGIPGFVEPCYRLVFGQCRISAGAYLAFLSLSLQGKGRLFSNPF